MDLYADLPLAKGAAADATATGNSTASNVWAKGVTAFVPGQRQAPSPVATSVNMLPSSLAASRARSPGSATATAVRPGGRGISLAFRPASLARKAPLAAAAAVPAPSACATAANTVAAGEDAVPRGGLGFVAATTWTQVTVQKDATDDGSAADVAATSDVPGNTHFFQAAYRDEYHPSRPNSYEAFCDERAAKKKLEQVRRELDERQREQERESKREREQFAKDVSEGKTPTMALPSAAGRGRGMTVPAWMKKKIEESASKHTVPVTSNTTVVMAGTDADQFDDAPPRGGLGFSSASDRGVGRASHDEFGRDVSARSGHDRAESRSHRRSRSRSRERSRVDTTRSSNAPFQGQSRQGRVVLLQNMVGPGEVDDELEEEVKEECTSKYGPVEKCVVFELRGRVGPEEAVRIFVQFQQQTHADQALNGLNGRFFGGRRVKATYYDEEKFARRDLSA